MMRPELLRIDLAHRLVFPLASDAALILNSTPQLLAGSAIV